MPLTHIHLCWKINLALEHVVHVSSTHLIWFNLDAHIHHTSHTSQNCVYLVFAGRIPAKRMQPKMLNQLQLLLDGNFIQSIIVPAVITFQSHNRHNRTSLFPQTDHWSWLTEIRLFQFTPACLPTGLTSLWDLSVSATPKLPQEKMSYKEILYII